MGGAWPFELMEGMAAAFPADNLPDRVVSDLAKETHDGAENIEAALQGQTWTELSQEALDAQAKNIIALTPEALAAYLPAFLRAAIKNPEGESATYVFYAIAPLGQFDVFYAGTCKMFTREQAKVVAEALRHMQAQPSFAHMQEEFPPVIELWQRRADEA